MLIRTVFAISIILFVLVANAQEEPDLDKLLKQSIQSYEKVNDYTCIFHKKELVRGKLREERNIIFKFMKPQHFYLKWTEGSNKGVESIFVEGKYNNKLVVHLGKIFEFVKFSVDHSGYIAMRSNRHPIMEAGLGHIIQLVRKNYLMAKDDGKSSITYKGQKILNGRNVVVIKAVLPKGKGYYGHIIYLYFDTQHYLPIKITVFGWENDFLEDYHFENIKLNAGLMEKDFDIENPEYNF